MQTSPGYTTSPAEVPIADDCDWRVENGKLLHASVDTKKVRARDLNEADVDGVAPLDLIARLGECGAWGDCLHVVLRGCGGSRYKAVWGPEYAQSVAVGARTEGAELADLRLGGRTARTGCDLPLAIRLTWTGAEWRVGEICVTGPGVRERCDVYNDPPPPECS